MDRPWLGALMMSVAMFAYPVADAATKYLGQSHSALGVTWARLAVCTVAMVPLAVAVIARNGIPRISRRILLEQTIRAALVVAATVLFILAITRIPLADTVGAYLVGPLVATLLGALVLHETLTRRRVLAVLTGFIGAAVIVRPGLSWDVGYLFALAGGACYGGFLVANRLCRHAVHPFVAVAFQMALGTLLLTPVGWREAGALWAEDPALLLLIGVPSALANVLVVGALARAPTASLAPLVYLEVVGATALGYLVFDHLPDGVTLAGIVLIVVSGVAVVRR